MEEHDKYIGQAFDTCPDGTVAVVSYVGNDKAVHVRINMGGEAFQTDSKYQPIDHPESADEYEIHHIIKLGKERPKTLEVEGAGVAWKKPDGWVVWQDRGGRVLAVDPRSGFPHDTQCSSRGFDIGPDWTCLGRITGLTFDTQ